ncbi:MAG: Bpu10I family restriction endonuclease, partial [Methanosarcinales archaeon]
MHIPIVSIECKTYRDKTMFEGSVSTAEKIKKGNLYCIFLIV